RHFSRFQPLVGREKRRGAPSAAARLARDAEYGTCPGAAQARDCRLTPWEQQETIAVEHVAEGLSLVARRPGCTAHAASRRIPRRRDSAYSVGGASHSRVLSAGPTCRPRPGSVFNAGTP